MYTDFNSRPREGGDFGAGRVDALATAISIRAPAKGATFLFLIYHI